MTMLQHGMMGGETNSHVVGNSLRLREIVPAYLSRTPSIAGNRKTWTFSSWVKRTSLADQVIFSAGDGTTSNRFYIAFSVDGTFRVVNVSGGVLTNYRITTQLFRDVTAWTHVVVHFDTTQSTANDRIKIFIDGTQITSFSTTNNPSINYDSFVNSTGAHRIGSGFGSAYYDGYLSEVYLIDGLLVSPNVFAQTDPNGVWSPLLYSGYFGTNGFYLPFSDGTSLSTLTADASGNGNNWTATGVSLTSGTSYDWMEDTPSNNFATMNPLDITNGVGTLLSGNLVIVQTVVGNVSGRSTIPVESGKYYVEFTLTDVPPAAGCSAIVSTPSTNLAVSYSAVNGQVMFNGSVVGTYATSTTGDVIAIAVDRDANTASVYRNGTLLYSGTGLASGALTYRAYLGDTGGWAINFGQRPFSYTPPTGYQKLCTNNLTSTTITTSGSFTGNAAASGPFIWLNGTPTAMTINGNAVTFGTHVDKTAGGFKLRTSSASYNTAGTNTYSITTTGAAFKYARAQANP